MNRRDSVLLERGAQLDVLDTLLADAGGAHGRLALVEGAAGTGKTALLDAACVRAPGRGVTCLRARGAELEQEFPFGLMHQLLGPPVAALDVAARERLLRGPLQPAALAVSPDRDLGAAAPPDGVAMWNALTLLTSALAASGPLLLCVDDAHWGDASSLRALSFLAGRLSAQSVALVVATRLGEPRAHEDLLDALRAEPGSTRIPVEPLGPGAVAAMVRSQLPGADDPACDAAAEATAGNPLYLAELMRAIDEGPDAGEAIRRAAIPSLGDQVARRIERVDPAAPALARAMAVMGDGATLDAAATLAGLDRAAAGPMANQLRRIEVLASEDPIAFVHPLVRRSVYDAQSAAERDAAHDRAAEILAAAGARPAAVAAHRAAVTPRGSSETARTMLAAGAEAAARGAADEALRWYRRALEEDAPEPGRAEILAGLGEAEMTMLDPAGVSHLGEAAELGLDGDQLGRAAITLAGALSATGRWREAGDVIERTQAEVGDANPAVSAELAGIGMMIAGYSVPPAGRTPPSPARLDALMAGDTWEARGLAAVRAAMALHRGEPLELVRAHLDRALAGDLVFEGAERGNWATANLLVALAELDDHDRGIAVAEKFRAAAERGGSLIRAFTAEGHRDWIKVRRGELGEAAAALSGQIDQGLASGNMSFVAGQLFYSHDALLECSGLEEIADVALTLDIEAAALTGTIMEMMLHVVRGRLLLAAHQSAEAERELRMALDQAGALEMGVRVSPIRSLLAASLDVKERDEARALVAAELHEADAGELARPRGIALRAAALLADDDATATAQLRASVELFVVCGARLEQARSLVALGRHLRRTGSRTEARAELETAVELARACGADLLVARAQEEARAAGARPRREAHSGPQSLTPSEQRVARLAAEGATNAQIARSLVLSPKTVETHLTHVYGKLGLSGAGARGRLGEALEAPGR